MKFWNTFEHAAMMRIYPISGARGVHAVLPHRPIGAIRVRAFHHGLLSGARRRSGRHPRDPLHGMTRRVRDRLITNFLREVLA